MEQETTSKGGLCWLKDPCGVVGELDRRVDVAYARLEYPRYHSGTHVEALAVIKNREQVTAADYVHRDSVHRRHSVKANALAP